MPYKISGTKSETARIIVLKESDWSIESNTVVSGSGNYTVQALVSGTKSIIARNNNGLAYGYGSVEPIYYTPVNVALGKSCTASNYYSDKVPGQAVNGLSDDPNHGWVSGSSAPQWWRVDLGQQYNVSRIDIYIRAESNPLCYSTWCYDYTIQGSNNDSDWDVIVTESHTTEYLYIYNGLSANYRYLKVNFSASNDWSNWVNILEFEAYA